MELRISEGANLPCSIFEFLQGGLLAGQQKVVLCYYIADGEYWGSRSLGSRIRRHRGPVDYVAQVQIVASNYLPPGDSTMTRVCTFAVDSATEIARLFVNMNKDRRPDESAETPEE